MRALFDYFIVKTRSSGFLTKKKRKAIEDDFLRIFVQDPLALGFNNLFFTAFLLVSGAICAILLCLAEKFHRRPHARNQNCL